MSQTLLKKFQQAENYIESLGNIRNVNFHQGTSNPKHHFKRARLLLKLAGNPDKKLKIIHVAGTSGKGSTVNHLSDILQKSNFKVGAHFSPFVGVSTEKIQINNKFISAKEFLDLVEEIKPIIEKCHKQFDLPSYFEVWLLLALKYFQKKKVDYVLLETGCGGRYDGTNAVDQTELSIITNIGLDHTHILGNSLGKIAYEKAGIIRQNGTVFSAVRKPVVQQIIKKEAQKLKADLHLVKSKNNPNQTLVSAVAQYLDINENQIKKGLKHPSPLPARMEILQKKPLIIMDGAHIPDKLGYLAKKISDLFAKSRRLHIVCALGDHKNPKKCFEKFSRFNPTFYCTRSLNNFRKFIDPLILAKKITSKTKPKTFLDPYKALDTAMKNAKPDNLILITGSFFLCSDLRKKWISPEKQLEQKTNFPK